jgi:hypothetical protein
VKPELKRAKVITFVCRTLAAAGIVLGNIPIVDHLIVEHSVQEFTENRLGAPASIRMIAKYVTVKRVFYTVQADDVRPGCRENSPVNQGHLESNAGSLDANFRRPRQLIAVPANTLLQTLIQPCRGLPI